MTRVEDCLVHVAPSGEVKLSKFVPVRMTRTHRPERMFVALESPSSEYSTVTGPGAAELSVTGILIVVALSMPLPPALAKATERVPGSSSLM